MKFKYKFCLEEKVDEKKLIDKLENLISQIKNNKNSVFPYGFEGELK